MAIVGRSNTSSLSEESATGVGLKMAGQRMWQNCQEVMLAGATDDVAQASDVTYQSGDDMVSKLSLDI